MRKAHGPCSISTPVRDLRETPRGWLAPRPFPPFYATVWAHLQLSETASPCWGCPLENFASQFEKQKSLRGTLVLTPYLMRSTEAQEGKESLSGTRRKQVQGYGSPAVRTQCFHCREPRFSPRTKMQCFWCSNNKNGKVHGSLTSHLGRCSCGERRPLGAEATEGKLVLWVSDSERV